MPAAAMRRRCPRVATSSKAPSSAKGVMLMTKVLGRPGPSGPASPGANAQALPTVSNLNSRSELPARMACFSSGGTSENVALIVFHEYGQSVVMWG
jgi:hypothetical protein